MAAQKLTKTLIAQLKPGSKDYAIADTESPLRIKVTKGGTKTYQIVRKINGKTRTIRIGDARLLTLEQVRREAKRVAAEIELGKDPVAERRAKRIADQKISTSFADVAERYITAYTSSHTGESIKAESRAARRAASVFANLTPGDVDAAAVQRLKKAYTYSPSELRKVYGAAKRVMDHALDEGLVEQNIFLGIKPPKPPKARSAYPTLSELCAVWRACLVTKGTGAQIIRFLIAMPLRTNAAASLKWSEVDLKAKELSLAAHAGRKIQTTKRLPLPSFAVDMLSEFKPDKASGDDLVFPSGNATNLGGKFSGWSNAVERLRERSGVSGWTPHDFRRSVVSIVAEQRPDISETALDRWLTHSASSTNSGVKAVYQRAQGFAKMRQAADAWNDILSKALNEEDAS